MLFIRSIVFFFKKFVQENYKNGKLFKKQYFFFYYILHKTDNGTNTTVIYCAV